MDGFGDGAHQHKAAPFAHLGAAGGSGSSGGSGTPTGTSGVATSSGHAHHPTYLNNGYSAASYGATPSFGYGQQPPYHNGDGHTHGFPHSALSSGPHSPISPSGPGSSSTPSMSLLSQALQMASARQQHSEHNSATQPPADWQQYDSSHFGSLPHAAQHSMSYPHPSSFASSPVAGSHFAPHGWQQHHSHAASPYTPSHPGSTEHSRRPSVSLQTGVPGMAGMNHQQALHLHQQLRDAASAGPSSAHQSPGASLDGGHEAWQHRPDMWSYRQPSEALFSPGVATATYEDQLSLAAADAAQAAAAAAPGSSAAAHDGHSRAGTGAFTPASSGSGVGVASSTAAEFSSALEGTPASGSGSGSGFSGRIRRGSSGPGDDDDDEVDPEVMAKKDPLATQVWRMYAKQKNQLSNGARMENITWRMMAMTLRKKKEEERLQAEAAAAAAAASGDASRAASTTGDAASAGSRPLSRETSGSGLVSSASQQQPVSAMKASTSLQGLSAIDGSSSKGKGRARFAEVVEEEERGRRGRSPRTPESHL